LRRENTTPLQGERKGLRWRAALLRSACTVRLFSQYWFSLVSHLPAVLLCALSSAVCPEGQNRQNHGPLRLPVRSGRVVEPNYARQLLAHPSGSAEPAGGFGLTLWSDGWRQRRACCVPVRTHRSNRDGNHISITL